MMDSGTCRIYTVTDAAENGEMPNPTLHEYGDYEWSFEDRMISYSRQYAAMGADQQIDRIIRIWRTPVRIGDVAVVTDRYETGAQYRINNVQPTLDDDGLEVTDITLRRLEENYDIAISIHAPTQGATAKINKNYHYFCRILRSFA